MEIRNRWKEAYGFMNSATKRMDRQTKRGLATNGLERMSATEFVGRDSCVWRDGDHTERRRVDIEGIRLPVTVMDQHERGANISEMEMH
jgi:hypothetical protein